MEIFNKKSLAKDEIIQFEISDDITKKVTNFYSENPFPSYNNDENKYSLIVKGDKNIFAKEFKDFIGLNKKVLEVGSGTSQFALYLSIGTNNQIFALDPTLESLKLGQKFAKSNNIENTYFVKADIFDDVLNEKVFDFVLCNGVLHHTKDPYDAFKIVLKSLKKDGIIVLGLYNRIARIRTLIRKYLYKIFGKKIVMIFDPHLRKTDKNLKEKIEAWIKDQYEHPVESLHSFDEILNWFKINNVEFVNSMPHCNLFSDPKNIFEKSQKGNFFTRLLSQILMIFSSYGSEGGVFIFIGKKV